MSWRAFRGANGWYVAWEDATGTHYQPADGGRLTEEEAKADLRQAQEEEESTQ